MFVFNYISRVTHVVIEYIASEGRIEGSARGRGGGKGQSRTRSDDKFT